MICSSRMKNCAEHCSDPQMTGSSPPICLRVTSPSCPQVGHDKHRPVRIFLLPDLAGIFQDKNGSRLHLFGDPFAKDAEFSDHVPSFRTVQEALSALLMMTNGTISLAAGTQFCASGGLR